MCSAAARRLGVISMLLVAAACGDDVEKSRADAALDRCDGAGVPRGHIGLLVNEMATDELRDSLVRPKPLPTGAVSGSTVTVCTFSWIATENPDPSLTACPDGDLVDLTEPEQRTYLVQEDGSLLEVTLRVPSSPIDPCP